MEYFSTVVFYLRPNRDRESAILMESLFRLTQKALLSGSLSATDAGAVLRCVDAVVARGSCGYLAYLEADLLKADTTDKGDDGEKNIVQGDSGGLELGYVDSVPSQDNLQMRRN